MKKSFTAVLILTVLLVTCKNHVLDNPVDPEADNYIGIESVDLDGDGVGSYEDVDEVSISGPVDGTIFTDTASPVLTVQLLNPEVIKNYRIQISTVSNFASDIVFDNAALTSNKFTVPAGTLANNTTYYWRAMAFDGVKWSDGWSSVRTFTVDIDTEVPMFPSPIDGSSTIDTTPILDWEDITDATGYHIQVNTTSDFTGTVIVDDDTLLSSEYSVLTKLDNSRIYYWRVKAKNLDDLWSDWSYVWWFSIKIIINFTEHNISSDSDGGYGVYATDVDSDGDIDILGASIFIDEIAWFENDGNQNFTKYIINNSFLHASDVFAIDLDGDGDNDVLGAANGANDITWWDNDGDQNFTEYTIDGSFDGPWSIYASDLDNDGDMDVLGTSVGTIASVTAEVAWWENDGSQNFTKHIIKSSFYSARSVFTIDIDGDGDVDVLGAASGADKITWWENDGNQNFTEYIIDGNFDGAFSVYASDLDNDGDIDVLGAASDAAIIAWWENDGNQNFTKYIIEENFTNTRSIFAIDVDGDGDIDVLGSSENSDCLIWWENNRNKNFSKHVIANNLTGNYGFIREIYAIDVDLDGDMDIVGGADRYKIIWWENSLY